MNRVFLTGATGGLGHGLACEFGLRGWELTLPVRERSRLAHLRQRLRELGAPEPEIVECDLSDHAQVRALAVSLRAGAGFDVAINCAGIGGGADLSQREVNDAGTELRMAVNAVTPHLLATGLAQSLRPGGRIIQVGSVGQAPLDPEELNFEHDYDGIEAYCRSKLALIMSTIELAERGIPVNVIHPARQMATAMTLEMNLPVVESVDDGVLAVLRLALDTALADVSGRYFDRFDVAAPHPQAADVEIRRQVTSWLEVRAAL